MSKVLTGCERIAAEARFLAKLETKPNGCRVWTGALSRGGNRPHSSPYGSFRVNKELVVRAHVFAAYMKGLIPDLRTPCGMHIDHGCEEHGTMCCDCLELVPAAENLRRITTRPRAKTQVAYRTKPRKRVRRSSPRKVAKSKKTA